MIRLLTLTLLFPLSTHALDHARLLHAIEAVEGGDPDSRGGQACITEAVYRQHGQRPYRDTALRHLAWLERQVGPDVERIALAWRWGVTGLRRHLWDDYGVRVHRIYLSNP